MSRWNVGWIEAREISFLGSTSQLRAAYEFCVRSFFLLPVLIFVCCFLCQCVWCICPFALFSVQFFCEKKGEESRFKPEKICIFETMPGPTSVVRPELEKVGLWPLPSNVVELNSRAVKLLMTKMRDVKTGHKDYVHHADRLLRLLAEEGLAHLPSVKKATVQTPCGPYEGLQEEDNSDLCVVSIIRYFNFLAPVVRAREPSSILRGHPFSLNAHSCR